MTNNDINFFNNNQDYIPKSEKDINNIALGIYKNEIFTSMQIKSEDANLVLNIFLPLAFMSPIDRKKLVINQIAHFYAPFSDSFPRSINGYPCFSSLQVLNIEDSEKIIKQYFKIKDTLENE